VRPLLAAAGRRAHGAPGPACLLAACWCGHAGCSPHAGLLSTRWASAPLRAASHVQRAQVPVVSGHATMGRHNKASLAVRRLTSVMRELGHDWVDLLKVDVEGAEWAALAGLLAEAPHAPLPFTQMQARRAGLAPLIPIRWQKFWNPRAVPGQAQQAGRMPGLAPRRRRCARAAARPPARACPPAASPPGCRAAEWGGCARRAGGVPLLAQRQPHAPADHAGRAARAAPARPARLLRRAERAPARRAAGKGGTQEAVHSCRSPSSCSCRRDRAPDRQETSSACTAWNSRLPGGSCSIRSQIVPAWTQEG